MLNICLCDDDINVLNYYLKKIGDLLEKNNYGFKIDTFRSGESLIFELEDDPNRYNIMVIDIIMKKVNGIETAKILRKYGYNGIIIFLTSSKEFAFDSFKVDPLNYILKNDDRFDKIFLKAVSNVYKNLNKNIIILSKKHNKIINIDTITYMESLRKKVVFHKISGEIEEINCTLQDAYEKVKEFGFIRCHKSYIVNIKYIQTFNKLECRLQKNIIIPIGRKYSHYFRDKVIQNEFDDIIF